MKKTDFPFFSSSDYVYLDNAATTQKPQCVLDKMMSVYALYNSNVHRSPHFPGRKMTQEFETARETVRNFFHADKNYDVVFTSGATNSINLTAYSYLNTFRKPNADVIVMCSEHHSNFVPWQQLCKNLNYNFRIVPVLENGQIDLNCLKQIISSNTLIVAAAHITNTFGIENPIQEIIQIAHSRNVPVLIDGSQAAAHKKVNISELGCDFYCLSSHKVYGPTGIGALIARKDLLNQMEPFQFGGEMVDHVFPDHTVFQDSPYRFEAGTPNFIGAIGFAEALRYLHNNCDMDMISSYEKKLSGYLWEELHKIPEIRFPVNVQPQSGILSFLLGSFHPYDVAVLLDKQKIAVRSGSHCAHPLLDSMGLKQGTVRISLGLYNTEEDIDLLCKALRRISQIKL